MVYQAVKVIKTYSKQALLSIVCLFLAVSVSGKKTDSLKVYKNFKNSVYISTLDQWFVSTYPYRSHIPDILSFDPADVFGITYEHEFYNNFGLGASYMVWNPFPFLYQNVYTGGQTAAGGPLPWEIKKGAIEYIKGYKMMDFYFTYKYNKFKRHKIMAGIGPSYTWGTNTIIDTFYIYKFDAIVEAHDEPASYYGIQSFISYDYLCLRNKLSLGYQVKYRQYNGLYSPQLIYGFNIKFNF